MVTTSDVFIDIPKLLRSRVMRRQNIHHPGRVFAAEVDLGRLKGMSTDQLNPGFSTEFRSLFDMRKNPHTRSAETCEVMSRLGKGSGLPISEAVWLAALSLETSLLSLMNHSARIAYHAIEDRPGNTVLFRWETFDPRMSRDALNIALLGVSELCGLKDPEGRHFKAERARLFELASRRRLAHSTAILKAAASAMGIPCRLLSPQDLVLGEGAHQQSLSSPPNEITTSDEAKAIIRGLFPQPVKAFIPSLIFAGDRATSAAARRAAEMLITSGRCVGIALKQGVFVNDQRLEMVDRQIRNAPSLLLRDPTVEALVTALSLRRVVNHGLGMARCDGVALLLESGEGESITARGIDVLTRTCQGMFTIAADDPALQIVTDRIGPDRVIAVSMDANDPAIVAHIAQGGLAAVRRWDTSGPHVCLMRQNGVLADAPMDSSTQTRARLIEPGMHAFALVHATGLAAAH